jgi:PIN domain nuclease of toxin-antitoxin system
VTGDKRLSRKAATRITAAQKAHALYLSAISIWELAKKVEKKQMVLDRSLDLGLDLAIDNQELQIVELSRAIPVESCRLPGPFHGDPADQIIVATARDNTALLISKDDRILSYAHVDSVW